MVEINVSQFVKECRKLRIVLADEKADPDILAECDNVITDATEPLMIMVMGEFSTGKSSFINALLGKDVTVVNATPTTAVITKLRYGRQEKVIVHYKDGRTEEQGVEEFARLSAQGDAKANAFHRKLSFVERVLPLKILKDLTIIDSPGLNSLVESHTQATKSFMGKADVVFWMFSVEDPVSRTELDAMRRLGARLKPVALVNKMDTIDEEEDDPDELLEQIRIKLDDQVQTVIGISAKTALDLMAKNPKANLTESGLPAVEGYIEEEILPNRGKYKMETMVDDMSGLMLDVLDEVEAKEKAIAEKKDKDYAAYMDAKEHTTLVRDQLSAAALEVYQYVQEKPVKNSTDLLFLAFLHQHGFIVERDQKKQDEFLEQAALKKDANAQAYFGIQMLHENMPEKGIYWLKKSHEQGNVIGTAGLGICYQNGLGVSPDSTRAEELFQRVKENNPNFSIADLIRKEKLDFHKSIDNSQEAVAAIGAAIACYENDKQNEEQHSSREESDAPIRTRVIDAVPQNYSHVTSVASEKQASLQETVNTTPQHQWYRVGSEWKNRAVKESVGASPTKKGATTESAEMKEMKLLNREIYNKLEHIFGTETKYALCEASNKGLDLTDCLYSKKYSAAALHVTIIKRFETHSKYGIDVYRNLKNAISDIKKHQEILYDRPKAKILRQELIFLAEKFFEVASEHKKQNAEYDMVTSYNIVVESLSNNDQLKKDFVEKNSSKMKQIEFLSGSCITSPNLNYSTGKGSTLSSPCHN